MSTATSSAPAQQPGSDSAEILRNRFTALRLSFTWFGVRRSLSSDQCEQAAAQFGAERAYVSASKKLIDAAHPAMRGVNQVRREVSEYWKDISLPYPEAGIRLIRQADLAQLDDNLGNYHRRLAEAVDALESSHGEIKRMARERLGRLYCEADYPPTFIGLFQFFWDFPNVEPPDYLARLRPELYQQEWNRVRARFEEAVQLAERAFTDELSGLIAHLGERLSGAEDGRPKIFRDSAIENLHEFFERFQRLNIHSSSELEALVGRAQSLLQGVEPQQLRDSNGLRQQLATQLSGVQSVLEGLMVDRPRRRILRS